MGNCTEETESTYAKPSSITAEAGAEDKMTISITTEFQQANENEQPVDSNEQLDNQPCQA